MIAAIARFFHPRLDNPSVTKADADMWRKVHGQPATHDREFYPTMAELGLAVGDRVRWECTDPLWLEAYRRTYGEPRVHTGPIIRDDSAIEVGPARERFVTMKDDTDGREWCVSTPYLTKIPDIEGAPV